MKPFCMTASKFDLSTAVTDANPPTSRLYVAIVPTPPLPTRRMVALEVIVLDVSRDSGVNRGVAGEITNGRNWWLTKDSGRMEKMI